LDRGAGGAGVMLVGIFRDIIIYSTGQQFIKKNIYITKDYKESIIQETMMSGRRRRRRDDDVQQPVPSSVLVRFVRMMDWLVVAGGERCFVMMVTGSFDFLHLGVETVFVVGGVGDHPGGTIGFQETVRTFDVSVSVVGLVMALDVVGVRVVDGVLEVIRCGCVGVVVGVVVFVTVVLDDRWRVG